MRGHPTGCCLPYLLIQSDGSLADCTCPFLQQASDRCFAGGLCVRCTMPLLPRWRFMTDEAKAITKRVAVSAVVIVVALVLLRALLPWVVLGVIAWWAWKAISK